MKVVRETYELALLMLGSWALLMVFFFGMKAVLHLTESMPWRVVIRGILGTLLLSLWLLSFFLLRNAYAKLKGIRIPMRSFSSRTLRDRKQV